MSPLFQLARLPDNRLLLHRLKKKKEKKRKEEEEIIDFVPRDETLRKLHKSIDQLQNFGYFKYIYLQIYVSRSTCFTIDFEV